MKPLTLLALLLLASCQPPRAYDAGGWRVESVGTPTPETHDVPQLCVVKAPDGRRYLMSKRGGIVEIPRRPIETVESVKVLPPIVPEVEAE